jgi:branched-chain amino acid transport system substrate-binding protein
MKKVALVLVLLLIAVFIFGCASSPSPTPVKPVASVTPSASAPLTTSAIPKTSTAPASFAVTAAEPIKIGALLSLTGEGQTVAPANKAAIEYWLDQIGYQVAGRKIQLISEDDATNVVTAVDKARKMVQFDKIDVLLGPVGGATAPAVANFMKESGIPMLVWQAKSPTLLKTGGNNIFLPFGTERGEGWRAGQYAYDKLGYKTAVTIHEDFVSGTDSIGAAETAFQKQGGTVVQSITVKFGSVDLSPFVASMKQADVVFSFFTPTLNQRFFNQYFSAGLKMPLILPGCGQMVPKIMSLIGDKTIGTIGIGYYTSLLDTPVNKEFVSGFLKKYDRALLQEAGISSVVGLMQYLEAVKSSNGDTTPARLVEALHKVKVTTPAGVRSYSPEGYGIGDMHVFKIVKLPENWYDWSVIDTYSQIVCEIPNP